MHKRIKSGGTSGKGSRKIDAAAGSTTRVSTDHLPPLFSMKYFDFGAECPSEWAGTDMRSLFSMFQKAGSLTWNDIKKTGGNPGSAVGLGFRVVENAPIKIPPGISQDESISEMRATKKARVFGVRVDQTYYVIELDRGHRVFP